MHKANGEPYPPNSLYQLICGLPVQTPLYYKPNSCEKQSHIFRPCQGVLTMDTDLVGIGDP